MPDKPVPKVFISYSHDSEEHDARVLALADALRHDGIDAILDQYNPVPSEGWPRWMESQLDSTDFVLMVCTETYYRRVMGNEASGVGLGVRWESNLIYNSIYRHGAQGNKYLPILLDGASVDHIPMPVVGHTQFPLVNFHLNNTHYNALYRHLTGQDRTPVPDMGDLVRLEPLLRIEGKSVQPWNVPLARNPFFTAREDALTSLYSTFHNSTSVAITQPTAISGLGGIGKTQTAAEYAYRHRGEYDAVLWMKAENETTLRESFSEIARLLGLPEANEQDQNLAVEATKRWLASQSGWLLVMDNADDLSMAHKFLPLTSNGHILYTTRDATGGRHAKALRLDKLSAEDGALLLLRRAALIDSDALLDAASSDDLGAALKISKAVDGLPLALDQAGAFIQEQQTSVARYFQLYEEQEAKLLAEYGDPEDQDHASVAVTFSLAFDKANTANPAVGDLLRLCAFLAPDDIPELIFTQAADLGEHLSPIVGDKLTWEKLLGEACRYSLLSRDSKKETLNIHRLVQVIFREAMTREVQRDWAERAMSAVGNAFPYVDFKNWSLCDRFLPQAQVCVDWITDLGIGITEAGGVLNQAGLYLFDRGQYSNAEALYLRSLDMRNRSFGPNHPDRALGLNNLAELYRVQNRYVEAEPMFLEAIKICQNQLVINHSGTATCVNNLANLYNDQGRYKEAEPLYLEALEIHQKQLGSDHPSTATSLHNLASLYNDQGRYEEAESLYLEALEIKKKLLGTYHPDTASSFNNLAGLYRSQGRYEEAEPLYLEALEIKKKQLGSDHPTTATSLHNLAGLYYEQSRYGEAEPLYLEALEIKKKLLGSDHTSTALSLSCLAGLYVSQGRYEEAEPLYLEALEIRKRQLVFDHSITATNLNNLAVLYYEQRNFVEAKYYIEQALSIFLKTRGPGHSHTTNSQKWYDIIVELLSEQAG